MTGQSIVCGACTATVPYGRLSCPNCGELLASVAGARRPSSIVSTPVVGSHGDRGAAIAEAPPLKSRGRGRARSGRDERTSGAPGNGGLDALFGGAGDDGASQDQVESTTTGGHAWAVSGASLNGPATPAYMSRPNYAQRRAEAEAAAAAADADATSAAASAAPVPDASALAMPAPPMPSPALDASAGPVSAVGPSPMAAAPGAYVPPMPAVAMPAGPSAPARAWVGQSNGRGATDDRPTRRAIGATTIDAARIAEFVGSVSIAGAALAAVGFLLPWASVMIGSPGTGYFDRWGLAGPAHILVVLAILAVLALSILRNPIPSWIRTGIAGLGVGALLLGLTWPYLLGPLDAAPGVLIDAIGAIALIGAGILALVTDRHATTDRHARTDRPV